MVSDCGTQFNSKFVCHLCKCLGIKPSFSLAYHPQTDRQTERVNQSIKHFLRGHICHKQDIWAMWLPMAGFAYNNTKHSATGKSPFQAVHRRDPVMTPTDVLSSSMEADNHAEILHRAQEEIESSLCLAKEWMLNPMAPVQGLLERLWAGGRYLGAQGGP